MLTAPGWLRADGGDVVQVVSVAADRVDCRASLSCALPPGMKLTVHGGGVHTHMPILSDADKQKISALPPAEAQYINVSYCRSADDVATVRDFLDRCAQTPHRQLPTSSLDPCTARRPRPANASMRCLGTGVPHARALTWRGVWGAARA